RVRRRHAGSAQRTRGHPARARVRNDFFRERTAASDGAAQRAGTRRWWVRAGSASTRREGRSAPGWLLHWLERPLGKPGTCAAAAGARSSHRAAGDFRTALLYVPLGRRGGARPTGGPLRPLPWGLPPLAPSLPPFP